MRVLVACEFSGVVRDAFIARGHDAISCDLEPGERPGPHYQGDVRDILANGWDMMIAFPPCTYLSCAGARWLKVPGRDSLIRGAFSFVMELWNAPIPRIAIENPRGLLNTMWRPPDQVIEPFYFGDPYKKRTCLWLKNLPPLMATVVVPQWKYWIDGGRLREGLRGLKRDPKDRSRMFPGIAAAMAEQWGEESAGTGSEVMLNELARWCFS